MHNQSDHKADMRYIDRPINQESKATLHLIPKNTRKPKFNKNIHFFDIWFLVLPSVKASF